MTNQSWCANDIPIINSGISNFWNAAVFVPITRMMDVETTYRKQLILMVTQRPAENLAEIVAKLQAIAQSGRFYAHDVYDQERYTQLSELTGDLIRLTSDASPDQLRLFLDSDTGYVTPKVDVRAATFINDKLLLVQEKSSGQWSIPGGWADLGYSAGQIATKETHEEAGITVRPIRLAAVWAMRQHSYAKQRLNDIYKMFFVCTAETTDLHPGVETAAAQLFTQSEALATDLSLQRNLPADIQMLFECHAAAQWETRFD
ncbi:hypothetical protein L248_3003 [Schleiferilactobacillus shenzhenensis LY-73]|uniref:Nudix hydrolase domain-containing protein n=2 Tax=Schleiferilactobacillus shenzhenensis TaxID=1231337 RepID=U4TNP5_9LACO|nr:hypothetical protein L248_3003 [Schleiferilactobacillus shenzhenensis LY-73]